MFNDFGILSKIVLQLIRALKINIQSNDLDLNLSKLLLFQGSKMKKKCFLNAQTEYLH